MSEMTTEAKLAKIIEAQVRGGCLNHQGFGNEVAKGFRFHGGICLAVLLDPAGLKSVWGEDGVCEGCLRREAAKCHCEIYGGGTPDIIARFEAIARSILDTWLSSNGDAQATIQTAFDLLPDTH